MKSYILNSKRSPIGKFLGSFYEADPIMVSCEVTNALLHDYNKDDIDSVIIGNVISAGIGQGPARQIAIDSGIPEGVPAYTLNMVCGSGMKAIMNATDEINAHRSDLILAGGFEFMSNIPYATNTYLRLGKKFGDFSMMDLMTHDGLTDAFSKVHMGMTAENIAHKFGITREQQDAYSYMTQQRAISAVDSGKFKNEIVPVHLKDYKHREFVFDTDEFINRQSTLEKLKTLKPSFLKKEDGTVTAGNTSGINDGASFSLIASEEYVKEKGLQPEFEIVESVSVGCDPEYMGLGPYYAIKALLDKVNMSYLDVDYYEINEAFSAQILGDFYLLEQEYHLSETQITDRTNIWGSGIGLGHPLGMTGARIVTTLCSILKENNAEYGIASLCIGGGMGNAMLIRRNAR